MFCHHPDVLHYAYVAFETLGHDVYLADERTTKDIGFRVSSIKNDKFEVVDQLFAPETLYPRIVNPKFERNVYNVQNYDLVWSMMPEITNLAKSGVNTWFDVQMQAFLRNPEVKKLPGIKSANHPDAYEINGIHFCPNWVDTQPAHVSKQFITQLITEANLVDTTNELVKLKAEGHPVKIHGGSKCPDGFIRDIEILPYTSLLVHNKQFGINCYAVCKALYMGIPVYMSKTTKEMIGFGDLPNDLFFFKEEMDILTAYNLSLAVDNKKIADTYRSIYTLNRTINHVDKILHYDN